MALDADRLIKNEVRILKALRRKWIREAKAGTTSLPTIHHTSIKHYVEAVYAAHRATIEAWGDWRFHGPTITVPDKMTDIQAQPVYAEAKRWAMLKAGQEGISAMRASLAIDTASLELRYYSKSSYRLEQIRRQPFDYGQRLQSSSLSLLAQKTLEGYKAYVGTTKAMFLLLTQHQGITWVAPIRCSQRVSSVLLEMLAGEPEEWSLLWLNDSKTAATKMGAAENFAEERQVLVWLYTRFFEQMGERWATQTVPVAATLSVAPSSFLRLGEVGEHNVKTGNSSCYGNAKAYEPAKTYLSLMPSTYVAFFYRDRIAEQLRVSKRGRRIGKIAGRCYGILDPEAGIAATNFYMLSKEMATPALVAASKMLGMSFGVDKDVASAAMQYFTGYAGHPNGDYVSIAARKPFSEIMRLAYELFSSSCIRAGRWVDPCCDTMSRHVLIKQYESIYEARKRILGKSPVSKIAHIGDEFKQEVWIPNDEHIWEDRP